MNNTFILHPINLKKVETFYVLFILWSTEYRRLVMTRTVIGQSIFKKLNSAYKCKSINVAVFTAGIVCTVHFNCFKVYLVLLSMFLILTIVSCHFIMPNQIWNLNELLNAAICSNSSFVVPGDPEVDQLCFNVKKWQKPGMVSDLLFLSSNHVQTLRHVQSHLLLLVTKSWLISMFEMIDLATV